MGWIAYNLHLQGYVEGPIATHRTASAVTDALKRAVSDHHISVCTRELRSHGLHSKCILRALMFFASCR